MSFHGFSPAFPAIERDTTVQSTYCTIPCMFGNAAESMDLSQMLSDMRYVRRRQLLTWCVTSEKVCCGRYLESSSTHGSPGNCVDKCHPYERTALNSPWSACGHSLPCISLSNSRKRSCETSVLRYHCLARSWYADRCRV
jgi:hypothetical protein